MIKTTLADITATVSKRLSAKEMPNVEALRNKGTARTPRKRAILADIADKSTTKPV